ncbi:protein phosphatase 2C [Tieghemostelium lacteum]|uniref:Protein phosphatase 2C n=1 Tax=Tieghemostelium lacteum TaxID=361077 RepID=A0A151ZBY8_TIELA|nr:protein phosphatase 2C [Tieghemostelium lacteum]|eukprot:KYQ91460.1 protein phosphatase 2C [Tieghemostelium lacteum]
MSSFLSSGKRKSEPSVNSNVILENLASIGKNLSKSGGIDRPIPPPIENKPKRPLSLSIGTLSPPHGSTSPSPPLDSSLQSSGNTSPISSTSISPSTSQYSLNKPQFKMPPKSNSLMFSVIYDKTNTQLEYVDEDDLLQRPSIQKLLLGRNKLTYLPDRISELGKLTVIDVSYNRLKSIPVQISYLEELVNLNLSGNKFMISATKENEIMLSINNNQQQQQPNTPRSRSLSTTVAVTVDLDESHDNSSTVTTTESSPLNSPTAEDQQSLPVMNLNSNNSNDNNNNDDGDKKENGQGQTANDDSLNFIPWELSFLGNLKKLDLSSNQCRDDDWEGLNLLPNSIFWFTQIETLLISGCQLKSLSSDVQHLESLTYLDVSSNSLTELPVELSMLHNLKTLVANYNLLTEIPTELSQLSKSLVSLDISNNQITSIPESLCYLVYLEQLNLSNNKLVSLPDCLFPGYNPEIVQEHSEEQDQDQCGLCSLITLKLRGNHLKALPEQFFNTIRYVKNLDLSVNQLESIDLCGLSELDNLASLLLFNNKLKVLPESLFQQSQESIAEQGENIDSIRPNLTTLNASGNTLTAIPVNIWRCKTLTNLSLGYNQITQIEFPSDAHLVYYSLEELYLNGNHQIQFTFPTNPSNGIELFPSLRELSLANCKLSEIPKFILTVKSLEKLDLSYNQISKIPIQLTEELSDRLQVLLLTDNQLAQVDSQSLSSLKSLSTLDFSLNPCLNIQSKQVSSVGNELISLCDNLQDATFILNYVPSSLGLKLGSKDHQDNIHSAHYNKSERFGIYYSDIIGRRPTMEDSFSIHGKFNGNPKMDLISLFDGHAGSKAATYSSEHFPRIMKSLVTMFPSIPPLQWLKQAYSEISSEFRGYIANEKPELKYCGATAASLLLCDDNYCVSNIGDTRIVLCQNGKAIRLSFDHKPGDPDETRRISKLGGYVISNQHTSRVNGTLALSRSIGDFYMEPYVIPDPYLSITKRNIELDQFIIVACDGIWDEISDQLACDIVLSARSMKEATTRLRDFAFFSGSDDNISVIIIDLKNK